MGVLVGGGGRSSEDCLKFLLLFQRLNLVLEYIFVFIMLKYPVLWIRNDLFRIQLQIVKESGSYPFYLFRHVCIKNTFIINQKEESTNYHLPFSISRYTVGTVQ